MRRRELLKVAAFAAAFPRIAFPEGQAPFARVRPNDTRWPSAAAWKELGSALKGELIQPKPLPLDGPLQNPFYIGDQVSGTQVSGWLDAWSPAPSAYAVAALTSADVAAAVSFAREHDLRLVVKGGAHSYQGTSSAPDSLLVWTRAMNAIALHEAFVPLDCEGHVAPMQAVSVGAGCTWVDVYDAVTTQAGRYVQGGGCTTVGVAGLVQSGGFGSFSKNFGTAASGLVEAEVVTADGRVRIVNARRDPDLLWALKGGGGGSFGVVTRLTLRTHDLPAKFGYAEGVIRAASPEAFRKLVRRFVDHYAENLFNRHWGESATVRGDNTLKIGMVCADLDDDAAKAAWRPFFEWAAAAPGDYKLLEESGAGAFNARLWWDMRERKRRGSTSVIFDGRPGASPVHAWWTGDREQVGAFIHAFESLWLPASMLEGAARERLAGALFAASRRADVELHFNKGLGGSTQAAIEAARDTATNPAVLDAFALAIIAEGGRPRYPGLRGADTDDAGAHAHVKAVAAATAELAPIAPAGGSYVSESSFFNREWQRAFWGANYARLREVKRRYDPDGLFFVRHGVGSEEWSDDGFARR